MANEIVKFDYKVTKNIRWWIALPILLTAVGIYLFLKVLESFFSFIAKKLKAVMQIKGNAMTDRFFKWILDGNKQK